MEDHHHGSCQRPGCVMHSHMSRHVVIHEKWSRHGDIYHLSLFYSWSLSVRSHGPSNCMPRGCALLLANAWIRSDQPSEYDVILERNAALSAPTSLIMPPLSSHSLSLSPLQSHAKPSLPIQRARWILLECTHHLLEPCLACCCCLERPIRPRAY